MTRLSRSDLEAVLSFVAGAHELDFDAPYPVELLARLQELIPCDGITYQDVDLVALRFDTLVGLPEEDGADESVYWSVMPCPITWHRQRTRDLRAIRLSDLMGVQRFRKLPIYRDYFSELGWDKLLDLGLEGPRPRYRSVILFRETRARDFSARDRALLDVLHEHLRHLEGQASLRRRLAAALRASGGREAPLLAVESLTPREREIVDLVAEGKTNAEIAAQLWVAPSTVKKHLEHVYEKLGVGRRAAVAAAAHGVRRR